jgi:hypothetical protein
MRDVILHKNEGYHDRRTGLRCRTPDTVMSGKIRGNGFFPNQIRVRLPTKRVLATFITVLMSKVTAILPEIEHRHLMGSERMYRNVSYSLRNPDYRRLSNTEIPKRITDTAGTGSPEDIFYIYQDQPNSFSKKQKVLISSDL